MLHNVFENCHQHKTEACMHGYIVNKNLRNKMFYSFLFIFNLKKKFTEEGRGQVERSLTFQSFTQV